MNVRLKCHAQKNLLRAGFNIWSKMYYPKMVGLERLETSMIVNLRSIDSLSI